MARTDRDDALDRLVDEVQEIIYLGGSPEQVRAATEKALEEALAEVEGPDSQEPSDG